MEDTLIGALQNKQYSELKDSLSKVIDRKIADRIASKRDEVIARINGTEIETVEELGNDETDDTTDVQDTNDESGEGDTVTGEE
jgi:hypothetical protein